MLHERSTNIFLEIRRTNKSQSRSFPNPYQKKMMDSQLPLLRTALFLCASLGLAASLTLPYMVTNKPARHTKYMANATGSAAIAGQNGTKAAVLPNVAATTATKGVVLYRVSASNGPTCILLKADGLIEVYFKTHGQSDQADTYMFEDAVIEGDCKQGDTATMRIVWEGYTMIWNFAKTPGGERWYVSQVELTVSTEIERYHSIRSYILPAKSFKLTHAQMLFPTPVGQSFACEESIIDLTFPEGEYNPASLSGKVFLRTFQLQPFIYKGDKFGPAFDCNVQFAFRDETAPIAVGSTLAICTLGTVVGYGVYRFVKVKKVQYNTME